MDTTTIGANPPLTRTRQEKQKLIEQWQESGKTKKAFSYEHQIKYATFISWIHPKKKRRKPVKDLEPTPGFIPVHIQKNNGSVFAEVKLGSGKSIIVYKYVPADYLRNLLG